MLTVMKVSFIVSAFCFFLLCLHSTSCFECPGPFCLWSNHKNAQSLFFRVRNMIMRKKTDSK